MKYLALKSLAILLFVMGGLLFLGGMTVIVLTFIDVIKENIIISMDEKGFLFLTIVVSILIFSLGIPLKIYSEKFKKLKQV